MTTAANIAGVLGVGRRRMSDAAFAELVMDGLPTGAFESIAEAFDIPAAALLTEVGIPPRTLARRRREGRLRADESDRLARVARILAHAAETFGSRATAGEWLQRPNDALGGRTPLHLLATDIGTSEVDDVLLRIDHGVYS